MPKVKSTNIARVEYDKASETMTVHFKNGTTYDYHKVPSETYTKFIGADSVGSHFHSHIRTEFKGVRKETEKSK